MKLIRGHRWTDDPDSSYSMKNRGQPYIMKSGHLSGSVYITWRCSPYQWLATTIRAIFEKIRHRKVVARRSRYKTPKHLMMISMYYAITSDDYALERLLNCQRKGFTRVFNYYKHSMDEKPRFLIDQMLSSILWFQLRGSPRAKSIHYLDNFRLTDVLNIGRARRCRREEASVISNPWIVSNRDFTKGMALVKNLHIGSWRAPQLSSMSRSDPTY
jgi:hypothetical protein